jgi:hypothetical protein
MVQEIFTYLIIASAFFYAGYKVSNIFRHKKNINQIKSEKPIHSSGCTACSAECIMRDSVIGMTGNHPSRQKTKKGL